MTPLDLSEHSDTHSIHVVDVDWLSAESDIPGDAHPERYSDLIGLRVDRLLQGGGLRHVKQLGHQVLVVLGAPHQEQAASVRVGQDGHVLVEERKLR